MQEARPQSPPVFSERRFDELELHPDLQKGLDAMGFEKLTPIQSATLELSLAGKDVAGQAQTGTGKTAAFLVAVMDLLLKNPGCRGKNPAALIIAPTRELALQIYSDAEELGAQTDLRCALSYGGIDYEKQRKEIEAGIDILIGTPGRTIDYFKQKVFRLDKVKVVVLDEADRMFDLGFIRDIRYLLRRLPPHDQRLNMLFSATLSHRVLELAYEHMNAPERVIIESSSVAQERIEESLYMPPNAEKLALLAHLIESEKPERALVFCNTKMNVERVAETLSANGVRAAALSGDVRQKRRQKLLQEFGDGGMSILVATDVAARGLHIPEVSHVFNYDLPENAEDYVHRIGRTARLGAEGRAISFACEDFAFSLPDIEEYVGHTLPKEAYDPQQLGTLKKPERRRRRGRHGGKKRSASRRQGSDVARS